MSIDHIPSDAGTRNYLHKITLKKCLYGLFFSALALIIITSIASLVVHSHPLSGLFSFLNQLSYIPTWADMVAITGSLFLGLIGVIYKHCHFQEGADSRKGNPQSQQPGIHGHRNSTPSLDAADYQVLPEKRTYTFKMRGTTGCLTLYGFNLVESYNLPTINGLPPIKLPIYFSNVTDTLVNELKETLKCRGFNEDKIQF